MKNVTKKLNTAIYDMDYFSGSQVFLYISDIWVDEVVSLQYQLIQNKIPLYGYASQLFDDTAAGHVYVAGSFAINFTESGYLWAVLRRYKNIASSVALKGSRDINWANKDKHLGITSNPKDRRPVYGKNGTKINRTNIQRAVQGKMSKGEEYEFYNNLAGYATFDVNSPQDKIFEDIVEEFEDQVWIKGNTDDDLLRQIRRPDDNAFDDFDMYIVFGNYSNPKANHTVKKIVGVRLTSAGQMINVDQPTPVLEEYTFIAKAVI